VLVEFGKYPFEHFAWGQALFYYNRMSMVNKDHILGKAWEVQFAMLVVGKKCWVASVKKWLFKHQPQEVVGSLPPVQLSLETMFQPTVTHVFQARIAQSSLEMALGAMHIHPTRLVQVKG